MYVHAEIATLHYIKFRCMTNKVIMASFNRLLTAPGVVKNGLNINVRTPDSTALILPLFFPLTALISGVVPVSSKPLRNCP